MVSNTQLHMTRSDRVTYLKEQSTGLSSAHSPAAQASSCDEPRTEILKFTRKTGPASVIASPVSGGTLANEEDLARPGTVSISGTKAGWSPLDRYWSPKNSFPDYGTEEDAMVNVNMQRRLKDLNAGPSRHRGTPSRDEPSPKRQKKSSVEHSRLAEQTSTRAAGYFDLTASQSKADGEPQGSREVVGNVAEYRSALKQANGTSASRSRQRRQQHRPSADFDSPPSDDPLQAAPQDTNSVAIREIRPPFATRKRPPDHIENISDGEDELIKQPESKRQKPAVHRQTNFSNIATASQSKINSSRADITKTHFTTRYDHKNPRLRVKRAVSGKFNILSSSLPPDQQLLFLAAAGSPVHIKPVNRAGNGLPYNWLEVNLSTCRSIEFSLQSSPYLVIKRSSGKDIQPLLAIELDDVNAADCFVQWAYSRLEKSTLLKIEMNSRTPGYLERVFNRQLEESEGYRGSRGQDSVPDDMDLLQYNVASKEDVNEDRTKQPQLLSQALIRPKAASTTTERRSLRGDMRNQDSAFTPSSIGGSREEPISDDQLLPVTRRNRARKSTPPRPPTPERWTVKNPDWSTSMDWGRSLIFPATGKNRATVDKDDIPRLDEGEFLNDNLIIFYLRYLQDKLEKEHKDLSDRIYFLNTWFFEKLKPTKGRSINYDGVKGWTAKIDLFSYDYIIVPVNESAHWYLAIICNPSKLLAPKIEPSSQEREGGRGSEPRTGGDGDESSRTDDDDIVQITSDIAHEKNEILRRKPPYQHETPLSKALGARSRSSRKSHGPIARKYSPDEPRIITLDSLGNPHSPTCSILRDYLVQEIKHRKNIEIDTPPSLGMTAKGIPEQSNYYDCGPFLLGYIQEFLKSPDQFVRSILQKEEISWDIKPSNLRDEARDVIFSLQRQQQARLALEKEAKRQTKTRKQTQKTDLVISDVSSPTGIIVNGEGSASLKPPPPRKTEKGTAANELTIPKGKLDTHSAVTRPLVSDGLHEGSRNNLLPLLDVSSQATDQSDPVAGSQPPRSSHGVMRTDPSSTAEAKRASTSVRSDSSMMGDGQSAYLSGDDDNSRLLRPISSSSSPTVVDGQLPAQDLMANGSPTSSSAAVEVQDDPKPSSNSNGAAEFLLVGKPNLKGEHKEDAPS